MNVNVTGLCPNSKSSPILSVFNHGHLVEFFVIFLIATVVKFLRKNSRQVPFDGHK